MNLDSPERLERRFFARLNQFFPAAFGHVEEVHTAQWLVLYVFLSPVDMDPHDFHLLRAKTDKYIAELWKEPAQRSDTSFGLTKDLGHNTLWYYSLWLAVPPERYASDFQNFFPVKRKSSKLKAFM